MRSELEKIQYIEQYLEGNLPKDELSAFEESIQNNPQLAQEVELQNQLTQRINKAAIKEQLNAIHASKFGKTKKKWWSHVWLNTFIILIGITTVIGYFTTQNFEGEMAEIHEYEMTEPTITPIVVDSSEDDSLLKQTSETIQLDSCSYPIEEENILVNQNQEDDQQEINVSKFIHKALPHADNPIDTSEVLSKNFNFLLPPQDTITWTPNEDVHHRYSNSSTVLHLPKNLFTDKNNLDRMEIKFLYREFRTQAEMVYADIPMTYSDGELKHQFSSGGMFEFIPLDSNLVMTPQQFDSISIDFALVDDRNMDFYKLDNNQNWQKGKGIDYADIIQDTIHKEEPIKNYDDEATECVQVETDAIIWPDLYWSWNRREHRDSSKNNDSLKGVPGIRAIHIRLPGLRKDKNIAKALFSFDIKKGDKSFYIKTRTTVHPLIAKDIKTNPLRHPVAKDSLLAFLYRNCSDCRDYIQKIEGIQTYNLDSLIELRDYQSKNTQPYYQEKSVAKKYTFKIKGRPGFEEIPVVSGLRIPGFGVYNCDAIHRIKDQITAHPKYSIESHLIKSVKLIDLDLNAAFGMKKFAPKFKPNGDNLLLVFTKDGRLFYANTTQMKALGSAPKSTPQLEDITTKISNSKDLENLIQAEKQKLLLK